MSSARTLYVILGTLTVLVAPLSAQNPGDCGHCHWEENEYIEGGVHQMTDDEPKIADCVTNNPGHPTHDCENGDGYTWSPGPCEPPYPPCWEEEQAPELAAALLEKGPLSTATAQALQEKYPYWASYDQSTGELFVTGCDGGTTLLVRPSGSEGGPASRESGVAATDG